MKLPSPGRNTSAAEVTQISAHGVWMLVGDEEFFMSYEDFPWFRNATVTQIHHVRLTNEAHLHWPDLDVDLHLDSLKDLERYPLMYVK
ncbi:MAG: DUF2442 domain-containing protein [Candidatus Omnitrophica bacterium]|nr:DUF2442 domain-containing protein [Candidatus Omnitrophota bacterium]